MMIMTSFIRNCRNTTTSRCSSSGMKQYYYYHHPHPHGSIGNSLYRLLGTRQLPLHRNTNPSYDSTMPGGNSSTYCRNFSTRDMIPQRLFLWIPTSTIIAREDENHTITEKMNSSSSSSSSSSSVLHQLQNHTHLIATTLRHNVLLPTSAIQQLAAAAAAVSSSSSNQQNNKNNDTPNRNTTANTTMNSKIKIVQSVHDIVEAVNQHYSTDTTTLDENTTTTTTGMQQQQQRQFVGGMGEQDMGVYFISLPSIVLEATPESSSPSCVYHDLLNHTSTIQLLQDGIQEVKAIRHGVPFGIYTTGIIRNTNDGGDNDDHFPLLNELDIDVYEVSLFGGGNGNPQQYHQYITNTIGRTNSPTDDFYRICQFITTAVEVHQQNVEVSLLSATTASSETKESTQLALSLGARHVHLYTKDE